jgi:hypothetical protein
MRVQKIFGIVFIICAYVQYAMVKYLALVHPTTVESS